MNNIKKIRNLLIVLIILLIIIIIFIAVSKKDIINNAEDDGIDWEKLGTINDTVEGELIKDNSLFYTAENCINEYIQAVSLESKDKIYCLVDKYYINKNNITKDNVLDKCGNEIEENMIFNANNMYYHSSDKLFIIFAKGNIEKEEEHIHGNTSGNDEVEQHISLNYSVILKLDYNSMSYSIIPNYSENIDNIKNNVEPNEYNKFENQFIGFETIVQRYYLDYIDNNTNDIQKAYNTLDSEYREKRFKTINDYKQYIEGKGIYYEINKYTVNTTDEYTQYICMDEENNYYIFTETSPMQYTVILDTYTLDLPEFLEKYNLATPQEKVALNIQKFMQAIDSKDYNYAYNCLSDGFKDRYFNTVDEFKKYVEENFYSKNLVTYKEFEQEGELYKYTVNIDNASYVEKIKTKTFIVKLNEGTDFEMSFNV